jgi:hypothetical protein
MGSHPMNVDLPAILHRQVDRITTSWPHAEADRDARGWNTAIDYNTPHGSETTSVEAAALVHCRASIWLADARRWADRAIIIANQAMFLWPPLAAKGDTVAGITVGQRGNNIEVCGLCAQPVSGGHNDPIRRINGLPFHGKSCWYTVTRNRT